MLPIVGQVYNCEKKQYVRNGETKVYVQFRVGMNKPYKVEKEINGEVRQVREKSFITVKCFNGLADTIATYYGGDENKGRWIHAMTHLEEVEYDKVIQIDHPDDPNSYIETTVKVRTVELIMSEFQFVGDSPNNAAKPQNRPTQPQTVVRQKNDATGATPAQVSQQLSQPVSKAQPAQVVESQVVEQPAQVVESQVVEQPAQQPQQIKNIVVNDENSPF